MTVQTPHNEYPSDYPVSPPWAQETGTPTWAQETGTAPWPQETGTGGHHAAPATWPHEQAPAAWPHEQAPAAWPHEQAAAAWPSEREHHTSPGFEAATMELGTLPFGGAVPAYGSPENRHGQLLVRFPEAVLGEARPDAPAWRPVVAWTFFFSLLGVVSAMRRSGRAKTFGRPRSPYWIAFLSTLVAGAAFWSFLIADVVMPIHQHSVESAATAAVRAKVLGDGRIEEAVAAKVKSGGCVPDGDRGSDGLRVYDCTFQLADGRSAAVHIKADTRGNWETTK